MIISIKIVNYCDMRKNSFYVGLLFLVGLHACTGLKHVSKSDPPFKLPVIITSANGDIENYILHESDSMGNNASWVMIKISGQDSINLDTINFLKTNYKDYYHGGQAKQLRDSLGRDSIFIYVDYNTNVCLKGADIEKGNMFFPVYYTNYSKSDKVFFYIDSWTIALQEVLNPATQQYEPIEIVTPYICGTYSTGIVLHPGESVLVLQKKYAGTVQTSARLRYVCNDSVRVSEPYTVFFNPNQLNVPLSYFRAPWSNGDEDAFYEYNFLGTEPGSLHKIKSELIPAPKYNK